MSAGDQWRNAVRFSGFELDAAGELRSQGRKLKLQEQPLQILRVLMERSGEIVTREELRQKIWPSDTFVDFDHGINNAIKRLREALGDTAETPRYVETLPRRGYRFIGKIERETPKFRSLAVLPLENLSRDPEQEYFAEGLTEALTTTLAKIGELRVVSRTSAMLYKGARKSLHEIAQELQVDGIVEGTVLRSGDRVRISAQLIEAHTDTHLWAESYNRHLRDVLDLHSEVAQAIAREIQIKLTPQEQAQFAQTRPVDPEAYEAYLKGRYFWNKRTGTNIKKAVEFFQLAIDKDANYAAAYAGLADALVVLGYWGFAPPESSAGRARLVATKALELDDTSAEAHASLAFALLQYDRDFLRAEREFSRAIELDPGYATARQWHALCLSVTGNSDEAIKEIKRAVELDPVSSIIHVAFAGILGFARRWHDAIDESQRALDLDPSVFPASWVMGWTSLHGGECSRAVKMFEEAVKSSGEPLSSCLGWPIPTLLRVNQMQLGTF